MIHVKLNNLLAFKFSNYLRKKLRRHITIQIFLIKNLLFKKEYETETKISRDILRLNTFGKRFV